MKSRNLIYFCLILFTFIDNTYAKEKELDNSLQAQSLLSVLYAQSSAEYEASNIQTYVNAKSALKRALNDLSWTAAIECQAALAWNWTQTRSCAPMTRKSKHIWR